jgi:hypothetical protein
VERLGALRGRDGNRDDLEAEDDHLLRTSSSRRRTTVALRWPHSNEHAAKMSPDFPLRYGIAFVATQAVEMPIYLAGPLKNRPLAAFGASAITHPFAAVVLPALLALAVAQPYYVPGQTVVDASFVLRVALYAVASESFAIGVEALYLKRLGVRRPLVWSLVANLTSATIGAAITVLTGYP